VIVTHNDDGRPVDVGRGGVRSRVADLRVGVEESVEGGVIRAMPVPHRVTDVGVGVKEIVKLHEVLRCFDDVGVGVEDNVAEVAEVEVAEVESANDGIVSIFLFPKASVKEDFIFCLTAVAAFTADCSSLSTSDENIPGLIARWTARISSDSKTNPVVARGLEEPKACDTDDMVMAPEENFV